MRNNCELSEGVFIVHQVVKREARKRPRSRQFLEERPVRPVGRVIIAAAAKISTAEPRFQRCVIELVAGFSRESICPMRKRSPCACLNGSPEQDIRFAFTD